MSLAEPLASDVLCWDDIRARHPDEWVCLTQTSLDTGGAITAGIVIDHDRSMRTLLARIDASYPGYTLVQTCGRALRFPRLEVTDEVRDLIRARR